MQHIKSLSLCCSHSVIPLLPTREIADSKIAQFLPMEGQSTNGTAVESVLDS